MSQTGNGPEDFGGAFARIEAAVEAGDTDLKALGFWRLVREIKADPALSARWAEVVGRIDRAVFERRVHPRFPVWLGNALLFAGMGVAAVAIGYSVPCQNLTVVGALMLAAGVILSVTVHDLAHWLVGSAVGIRFWCYFLDGPFRVQPGLKSDYASYLRTPPRARAAMHAAGAVASKLGPVVPLGMWPLAKGPSWSFWALVIFGAVQILTDLTFSVRRADWKKVRRELAIARAQEAGRS